MEFIMKGIKELRPVFDKYAGKDGDPKTLSKAEVTELLKEEFQIPPSKETDEFFKGMDIDKNGVVDYQEFLSVVIALCVIIQQ